MIKKKRAIGIPKSISDYDESAFDEDYPNEGHKIIPASKDCDHSNRPILRLGKSVIYANSLFNIPEHNWSLIIDCSGFYSDTAYISYPKKFRTLKKEIIPVVSIPWDDYCAPLIKPTFWKTLVNVLPSGDIFIGCNGGHGRTGTALSAIIMVSEHKTVSQAVDQVRNKYCRYAVESVSQINHLRKLEEYLKR